MSEHRFVSKGWRMPALPGVNASVPPGASGLGVGERSVKKLQKFLRTFDNTKAVAALAPYARSADDLRDAILGELAARGFEVGPSVAAIVSVAAMQRMWFEILNDRALQSDDPKLAETASKIGDASKASTLVFRNDEGRVRVVVGATGGNLAIGIGCVTAGSSCALNANSVLRATRATLV